MPRASPDISGTYAFTGPDEEGEPGWRGVIFGDRMIYREPGGRGWRQANIKPEELAGAISVKAGEATVIVERGRKCSGSGALRDRVIFEADNERHEGCGGPFVVPEAITGTTWTLRELDGRRAPDGPNPAATMTFSRKGWFYGTSACAGVNGSARWTPDGRIFHETEAAFITTLQRCVDRASVEFGDRFWDKMKEARSWRREGQRLIITFADGSQAGLALLL
jgi:heat shock protein HslJ